MTGSILLRLGQGVSLSPLPAEQEMMVGSQGYRRQHRLREWVSDSYWLCACHRTNKPIPPLEHIHLLYASSSVQAFSF